MRYLILFCVLVGSHRLSAQVVLVNSASGLYQINLSTGLCSNADAGPYCNPNNQQNFLFSTALYNDTLFFIARSGTLYRMRLGNTGSCTALLTIPYMNPFGSTVNSLTADRNGILYAADGNTRELMRIDPRSATITNLGALPFPPAGDLIFYRDELYYSALNGNIYKVNIANPAASVVHISSVTLFYGLISVPFDCLRNKVYAFQWAQDQTNVYEVDLDSRTILGVSCQLPFLVYDGASSFDNGNTLGIQIDSLPWIPPCGNQTGGTLEVRVSTAAPPPYTFILDGTISNANGQFTGVTPGPHRVTVRTSLNCEDDTIFTLRRSLDATMEISAVLPRSCDTRDGSLTITAQSGFPPLEYSINGSPYSSSNQFTRLNGGSYLVSVRDASGCRIDSIFRLPYLERPAFLGTVLTSPTTCKAVSGVITVQVAGNANPADVQTAVNGGPLQATLVHGGLDAGTYNLTVVYQQSCRFDTIITVGQLTNPPPQLQVHTQDQLCREDNGQISLQINGAHAPYLTSLQGATPVSQTSFSGLTPGNYSLLITDKDGCETHAAALIRPYQLQPVQWDTSSRAPECTRLNGGSMRVMVNGNQGAYRIRQGGQWYTNGSTIGGLTAGSYKLEVYNADNCLTDTLAYTLNLIYTPSCDFLFVPTAFTPNNDGRNDRFRVQAGPGIRDFELQVRDRAGQLVFESRSTSEAWDGRLGGLQLPSQVFVWMIRYNTLADPVKKTMKGTLTLIR